MSTHTIAQELYRQQSNGSYQNNSYRFTTSQITQTQRPTQLYAPALPPTTFVKSGRNESNVVATISGPDRHKFFNRPLVAHSEIASIQEEKHK
jgi:hypothetical protein